MSETSGPHLSRRKLLATGSGLFAGSGLLATGAFAPLTRSLGFVTPARALELGEHAITVLSDGHLTLPMSFALPDRTPEEISALLSPHGLPIDALVPDCNVTLVRSGDRTILFDVGSGGNFQATAGELPQRLDEAGISSDEITHVVLTHGHPDHLWGMLDEFDEPLFANAEVLVPQAEWDYWRADTTLSQTPEERRTFVVGAQTRFAAIEDRVTLIRPGQEILPGIEAVDTAGHTQGHTSYMLHDAGESVLIVGDAISNAVISFERPDWISGSDQDPQQAIATRLALLDRLAGDRSRVIGYHFPTPASGRVERSGTAYRFVASEE
ncbi:MBL fold metallo-hydrolase [Roseibium aestuarii]|uniref:MBL fold metallo-hydrolase n=1 Tax=Roseibium aestuarii TaxID=2600299 RepID=A0ABW4JXF7_9HYPH|nr:MBL fold metallo-hydrolase [Roseibium aestuarii]